MYEANAKKKKTKKIFNLLLKNSWLGEFNNKVDKRRKIIAVIWLLPQIADAWKFGSKIIRNE